MSPCLGTEAGSQVQGLDFTQSKPVCDNPTWDVPMDLPPVQTVILSSPSGKTWEQTHRTQEQQ